jgi:drug/metabolite transporter (DMT)-like permease
VGGADFLGGMASRRSPATRVAATAQVVGLFIAIPAALLVDWDEVGAGDVAWSLASGVFVGVGLALFYGAMARGLISLVVPITAVTGAAVPVVFALIRGERPGTAALIGIVVALVAIALVSLAPGQASGSATAIPLAIAAGIPIGLFVVCFSLAGEGAGLWPVALSRIGSAVCLIGLALALTRGLKLERVAFKPVCGIAALEVCAGIALLAALHRGPVSVASVLAALYPIPTTILAATRLNERLGRIQLAAVILALGAVVLVSLD